MTSSETLAGLAFELTFFARVAFEIGFFDAFVFFFAADCLALVGTIRFFVVNHAPSEAEVFLAFGRVVLEAGFELFESKCFGSETVTCGFGDCKRR
jgi:hypothetical protein